MKAQVLHEINCLKFEDIPLPTVPEGWVLVEVKAVGICGSDIPRIFKTGAHRHPLVPGHEFSGRVLTEEEFNSPYDSVHISVTHENIAEKAGAATKSCSETTESAAVTKSFPETTESAAVTKSCPETTEFVAPHETSIQSEDIRIKVSNVQRRWAGKRVGVFPLIPCGKCDCCKQKKYEMCSNYNYLGSRCDGAFAQYVAVPEWNLLPLPDFVSYETAAMLEPMAVAAHALRAAAPEKDDVAAVCGLGTIGLLMVMLLKQAGVKRILAIGNKDFQKDCIKLISDNGSDKNDNGRRSENSISEECMIEFADLRTTDIEAWILSRTGGQGVTLYFECVGKNETLLQAIRCTQPGGRIELVGNPASDMLLDRDTYWKILRKQLTLRGTWNSSYLGETSMPAGNSAPDSTPEHIDDWHYVLKILPDIRPQLLITHRLPLAQLDKGLHIMRDKTEDFVKIMILP